MDGNKILFEMRQILFDTIIKNLITILNELNLKFKLKDKHIESNNSDPIMLIENKGDSNNIIWENSEDMKLFLNYTKFVTKFITVLCGKELKKYGSSKTDINPYYYQFQTWSINFIETLIDKSINNEYILGYYKLLQCIFKIYGKEIESNESIDDYYKHLIKNYLNSILSKLETFKDELLYSCMELLLNTPLKLLSISDLVPVLIKSLKTGLTNIETAELGISILEKWCNEYINDIKGYLPNILKHLRPYLDIIKVENAGIATNIDDDEGIYIYQYIIY